MPIWTLSPVDRSAEIWSTYQATRIVIRAPNELQAREQAAEVLPSVRVKKAPALARPVDNPWLKPDLTACEKIDPNGPPGELWREG